MGRKGGGRRGTSRSGGGGGLSREDKSPAETTIAAGGAPKEEFGPSDAQVKYRPDYDASDRKMVDDKVKSIFGRKVSDKDLASLVGAPHDATVFKSLSWDGTELTLNIKHPGIDIAERTLSRRGNDVIMHNDIFRTKDQGTGLGSKVIGRQMEQASKLGVTKIETNAARSDGPGGFVGYKVWPKMGYDAPIPARIKAQLPSDLSSANRLSDLYKSKKGVEFWEKNGTSIDVEFDLRPGSLSQRAMKAYQEARRNR